MKVDVNMLFGVIYLLLMWFGYSFVVAGKFIKADFISKVFKKPMTIEADCNGNGDFRNYPAEAGFLVDSKGLKNFRMTPRSIHRFPGGVRAYVMCTNFGDTYPIEVAHASTGLMEMGFHDLEAALNLYAGTYMEKHQDELDAITDEDEKEKKKLLLEFDAKAELLRMKTYPDLFTSYLGCVFKYGVTNHDPYYGDAMTEYELTKERNKKHEGIDYQKLLTTVVTVGGMLAVVMIAAAVAVKMSGGSLPKIPGLPGL